MAIIMPKLKINSQRLRSDFDELAEIGATVGGGVSRLALSNEDLEARAWFANRIEEAGMLVRDDDVGNLSGVLPSKQRGARSLLVGSHLDTVPNGGLYDGSIGVLAGLECLRRIKEEGIELPVHLEVINFTDEEGWWQSFFGSMGLTGTLEASHINDAQRDNAAFRAALFRAGIYPSEVYRAHRDPATIAGFIELHIEQSDRLEKANVDIGVVRGVVGRSVFTFTFFGEAAHAATAPMERRRDALQGAAIFITEAHRMVRDEYPQGVVNCGSIEVKPGTFNVVPAEASLSVEVRHSDHVQLNEMESRLIRLAHDCAIEYRLTVSTERSIHRPVALMGDGVQETVRQVCREEDISYLDMYSYAGHDAQILSHFTPSGMIFIPSINGISHNPKEYTPWDKVETGANVLLSTLLKLAANC